MVLHPYCHKMGGGGGEGDKDGKDKAKQEPKCTGLYACVHLQSADPLWLGHLARVRDKCELLPEGVAKGGMAAAVTQGGFVGGMLAQLAEELRQWLAATKTPVPGPGHVPIKYLPAMANGSAFIKSVSKRQLGNAAIISVGEPFDATALLEATKWMEEEVEKGGKFGEDYVPVLTRTPDDVVLIAETQ